jgi:hypothetical protein
MKSTAMNGLHGWRIMDHEWQRLVEAAAARFVVLDIATLVEALRHHQEYQAIVAQYRVGASDRRLGDMLDVLMLDLGYRRRQT